MSACGLPDHRLARLSMAGKGRTAPLYRATAMAAPGADLSFEPLIVRWRCPQSGQ
jgi:hypothetical protein